jgi:hypothetical protein
MDQHGNIPVLACRRYGELGLIALSTEHRIGLYAIYSQFGRGCALARTGQKDDAIFEIREGIEKARRSNLGYMRGFMLGWLAEIQAETGDPESGLSTIDAALKEVNDVAGHAWEAELRRLRGDIVLMMRPSAIVEAGPCYDDAIAIARHQCAHSLQLRAAMSQARLLRGQGRAEEAGRQLASIFDWFTEGLDTRDLTEARALLDALR